LATAAQREYLSAGLTKDYAKPAQRAGSSDSADPGIAICAA
jgi:hypothetical protein